jgi:hypothetical protein
VRGRLAWAAAALLGGVLLARAKRRPAPVDLGPAEDEDRRVEELRAKLAEARAVVGERDEFEGAETTVDAAEASSDPDERRRRVHEEGRAAVDRMRSSSSEPPTAA